MDYLDRYYGLAKFVSGLSDDAETKVGALLISKKTKEVIVMAANTFIYSANKAAIPNVRPFKYKYCLHAENNLICKAALNGISTRKTVVFVTHSPCGACSRTMFQAGITTIYFPNENWRKETEELGISLDLQARCVKINDRFSKLKLSAVK